MPKQTKFDLFKKLAEYNEKTGVSRIVCVDEFTGEYATLYQKNGGLSRSWDKTNKVIKVRTNGKIEYSWEVDDKKEYESEISKYMIDNKFTKGKGTSIKLLKLCGFFEANKSRPIRSDIIGYYKNRPCCVCGSKSDLVCDHKNDLYNNPRVLDIKTQKTSDFQSLCSHCNLLKRQICKKAKETGKRYGASNIPSLACYGIDFTAGDEKLDISNINAMIGTYWYDPVAFHKFVKKKLTASI